MDLFGFSTFHWVTKSCGKWNNQMKMQMKIKERKNETITEEPTMEERFEDYPSLQIKINKIPKNKVEKLVFRLQKLHDQFFLEGNNDINS
jgi:hypothetical protein